ncbi:MAG: MoxR family ATPase [Ruminococcus sp.]|jgi:MoxR-like ATPase|nr:MoxR family ATPase [Ruminococcus sp.]
MDDQKKKELLTLLKKSAEEIKKAVIGKDSVIDTVLMTILTKGHILLEDIPGVGKTTLAVALSKVTSLKFSRIQFTPDVMPSDVTGYNVYNRATGTFDFREGAVFCNLLLADELNRTSGKTQSALLEAMEEKAVTVDGVTRILPEPFIVIASQNPTGYVGTQLLPESQLDRFAVRLSLGYPETAAETKILKLKSSGNGAEPETVLHEGDILTMRKYVEDIFCDDRIYAYIAQLGAMTRSNGRLALGLSTRGTLSVCALSKAAAFFAGRGFVLPEDIKRVWEHAVSHRIILEPKAKAAGDTSKSVAADILRAATPPKL